MNFSPKTSWKATKTLKDRLFSHYKKKNLMRFKLNVGSLTKADKERADMAHLHFHKVLNRNASVESNLVKPIIRFETMFEINGLMSFSELNLALNEIN